MHPLEELLLCALRTAGHVFPGKAWPFLNCGFVSACGTSVRHFETIAKQQC